MPRYIDADALKDVIQQHDYLLADRLNSIDNGMFTIGIFQAIDQMPTLSPDDLRPVVFCKDCKFAVETKQPFGDDILLCTSIYNVRFVKDSFYCADGEKR